MHRSLLRLNIRNTRDGREQWRAASGLQLLVGTLRVILAVRVIPPCPWSVEVVDDLSFDPGIEVFRYLIDPSSCNALLSRLGLGVCSYLFVAGCGYSTLLTSSPDQ